MTNEAEAESQPAAAIEREALVQLLADFVDLIQQQLDARWEGHLHGASLTLAGEVIAGLLHRQAELAISFAQSPVLWRVSVAPILLRTMIETHINLAWILLDPDDRAEKFVDYGLGQTKLLIEHRRTQLEEDGADPGDDEFLEAQLSWLEAQRLLMLTEVNVGSWAGKSTRELAQEAGLLRLYTLSYEPFSGAVHSQWHHIGRLNSTYCRNPLHGLHRVPVMHDGQEIHHLIVSAKYLTRSLEEFDSWSDFQPEQPYPLEWLDEALVTAVGGPEQQGDAEA